MEVTVYSPLSRIFYCEGGVEVFLIVLFIGAVFIGWTVMLDKLNKAFINKNLLVISGICTFLTLILFRLVHLKDYTVSFITWLMG